jgi:UDP-N-acetylglucosamine acyltransferase
MSTHASTRIHPTAVVSGEARIAEDVALGPYVVVEGPVTIGAGCVVKPFAHLIGPLTMGCHNQIHAGAILGDAPQHLQYRGEPSAVEIGDHNVFREHVTVHRSTKAGEATRIGSHNYLMASSHVAHDCTIASHCIVANNSLLAGHCELQDRVFLSGNSALHQFCRVGRLAFISGCSASANDVPPFVLMQGINIVLGINVIGMRRAGIPRESIDAVREAFQILYRERDLVPRALARIERELGHVPEVAEFVAFIRESKRGISRHLGRDFSEAA